MGARRINADERRARLAIRHHLAGEQTAAPTQVAADLLGFHATDPASVYLAAWARIAGVEPEAISRELYDDRTLVRMLGMRRTMFVLPTRLAPVIQHACTDAVAARLRRTYLAELEKAGVASDAAAWLRDLEESVARVLAQKGEATGAQLSKAEPRLRTKVMYAEGKRYGGEVTITTWVLNLMAADGRIVRGRPGGAWNGSQYRWSPMERWLPGGLPRLAASEARAELVRRWLASFGPATVADIKWWTGWNQGEVTKTLADVDTVEVDLDGEAGLVLGSDLDPVDPPEPWVALLPALDPTAMGWQRRHWYLDPEHRAALFDRSGNIGPTIWCDGRIAGGWAQRKDGEIVHRLLGDVGAERVARIQSAAERLAAWHGDVRVIPRFRTPLERELTA